MFLASELNASDQGGDVKVYQSIRETLLPHEVERYREYARSVGIELQDYNTRVLYALSGDIPNSSLAHDVLQIQDFDESDNGTNLYVGPRPGTITPWASKAGNILARTGVENPGRIERIIHHNFGNTGDNIIQTLSPDFHDEMTQIIVPTQDEIAAMFQFGKRKKLEYVNILQGGIPALHKFNDEYGCGMDLDQIHHFFHLYKDVFKTNPTDLAVFNFAQSNSEHCFHGIFNGKHTIDGKKMKRSLFDRIKSTHYHHPNHTVSAYKDNAAAFTRGPALTYFVDQESGKITFKSVNVDATLKVETHNHPTAISPFPGAATGAGGEIRDEGAVGVGSKPRAGITSFNISSLNTGSGDLPSGRATPLEIITEGPLGGAAFNNEFGRPVISGDFRVFEQEVGGEKKGYHKPIMLAGGMGNVFPEHVEKKELPAGTQIIVLGGPSMNIGLGGAAGSSAQTGTMGKKLDFASVQRGNPEMQRRDQEVIDTCTGMREENPILFMHDVGAAGIGNAIPELVKDSNMGAIIDYAKVPIADPSLSPLEGWLNEAQERYVLAVSPERLKNFEQICERENCPYAVVGEITEKKDFILHNTQTGEQYINSPIEKMYYKRELELTDTTVKIKTENIDYEIMGVEKGIEMVIGNPTVGNKTFLITIGDRTVGGITVQDQMVGPWQTPVADAGIILHGLRGEVGEVITTGERSPLSLIDSAASINMAIGEAITNILSAYIDDFSTIAGSGNWMADKATPGQISALDKGVDALEKLCIALGISVPVGKDSLSMRTTRPDGETVVAPLTFYLTAKAKTPDVNKKLTPELKNISDSEILLVDLGAGKNRMGGSILAQEYNQFGNDVPNLDNPERLLNFMKAMRELHEKGLLLAYHDRSDGGLFATISEMSFASHLGVDLDLRTLMDNASNESQLKTLFNEELGAVMQYRKEDKADVFKILETYGLGHLTHYIGKPNLDPKKQNITATWKGAELFDKKRVDLQKIWSQTSYEIQKKRDNPSTAQQELDRIDDESEPPMITHLTFDISKHEALDIIDDYETNNKPKPRVAVLRCQGINGQVEMARFFNEVGFDTYDVHVSDLLSGKHDLREFNGIAIPGGFSFGDVLGAGVGFARVLDKHGDTKKMLEQFEGFTFGVCNGCQTIGELKDILPDGDQFPTFVRNTSTQFEARLSSTKITESEDSIAFRGMGGSIIPVISSHGEGRSQGGNLSSSMNYVDHYGNPTEQYPHNVNGSKDGATGFEKGRVCFTMPHPERDASEDSPWKQIALNYRLWVEENMMNEDRI